jgi:NADP-dependent 3-hydroxy acid dehydrogenase YdfG
VLNGVAAALPRFIDQRGGHFVNIASVGAHQVWPTTAVYSATKYAVWAITDGIRQEHNDIRATIVSPGVVESELADTITDPSTATAIREARAVALKPEVIGRAIRYAIEQPAEVGVNEVIVRPMGGAF